MTLCRVYSAVTPEQLGQSDPHMASSEEVDQTVKQLLLSWPDWLHTPIMQHAAGAAGQHWLRSVCTCVYICTLLYTLCTRSCTHSQNCRSDKFTLKHHKCPLYCHWMTRWMEFTCRNTNCEENRQQHISMDKCKPFPHSTFFSLLCAIMSTEPWENSSVCEQIKNQCNDMAH